MTASVKISAAVLMPVCASVGMPPAAFVSEPVVISDTMSACGNAGLERTEAVTCSVSLSGPFNETKIW